MTEQPLTPETEKKPLPVFHVGDKLTTARGATAEVLSVVKHREDKGTIVGYNVRITEMGKPSREVLLQNGALAGWHLATEEVEPESTETKPEIAALETAGNNDAATIAQLQRDLETANNLVALKDAKITDLRNTIDGMIVGQTPAAEHSEAQDDRNAELQEQVESLTAQLNAAHAELALSKVAPALQPAVQPDVLTAPKQEIHTLIQNMGMNTRLDSDKELSKQLNEGWEPMNISVTSGDDYVIRVVTLTRFCQPEPVPPQLRKAVETVGPHIIIPPMNEGVPVPAHESYAEAHANALNVANAHLAQRLSSLPTYNRPNTLPVAKPMLRVVTS